MKFDVVVGNPPYQENNDNNNRDSPVYNFFYELAEKISIKYCLISPARFLFNVGQTPKDWNEKMLNDKHLKVVYYEQKSSEVFPNTDIKGGLSIIYHDDNKDFGKIETFTSFNELKSILNKVTNSTDFTNIGKIIYLTTSYSFSDNFFKDYPNVKDIVNSDISLRTNIFDKIPSIFSDKKLNEEQICIYGRQNNQRVYKFIDGKYIQDGGNLNAWKIFVPKSNGTGAIGEKLSTPLIGLPPIGEPLIGHTQTFISIGAFDNELEAENCLKYIKSKFARTMLGIKKITQDNGTKETWKYVPLQDFTPQSDIDWTQSIPDIDRQLYKKYNLDENEIAFIEEKVRAME